MIKIIKRPTKKQLVWTIIGAVCLFAAILLTVFSSRIKNSQPSQQMAERWDSEGQSAQISCFFSSGLSVTPDTIRAFEHTMENQLETASITAPAENARLWVDAYSAKGKITLSTTHGSTDANAYGVGGDYFMFHPLGLEEGGMYFSGSDLMQDRVILDQNTAWQLFGSYDVAGQPITIGSGANSHTGVVAGVVESESGWMNEKAGAQTGTVYVSFEVLNTFGSHSGINSYEVVMPNPVTGFAKNMVTENIGLNESEIEVVENSSRYSFLSLLSVLGQFGTRSMNAKAIIYPYWENAARGWEDVLSIVLLFQILFYLVPVILVLAVLIKLWKRRRFHFSDVKEWLADRQEARWARQAQKKAEAAAEPKGKEKEKQSKPKKEKKIRGLARKEEGENEKNS